MVHLVFKQLLHGVDDAFAAGDRAPQILPRLVPEHELRLAAFAVLEVVCVILERLVGLVRGVENPGFFGIKQAGHDEVAFLPELVNLVSGKIGGH